MEIDFEWRLPLDVDLREALRQKIIATLERWAGTDQPRKVIVSRPTFDPRDERVAVKILAASGKVLGAGQITPPDLSITAPSPSQARL